MNSKKLVPLFIGLPGAGKTTLSAAVAQKMGLEVIGTDPLFRVFRAMPSSSVDPRAEVMRSFLRRAAELYPALCSQLEADAVAQDEKGRCALHDSVRFRAYGEDVFRLFEIEMLKGLDRSGGFSGKIVDLSASAPLYAENRALFAPENGYLPILVDTKVDQIAQNILRDYHRYCEQSRAAGEKKPIRGAYEKAIDAALAEAGLEAEQGEALILETALRMTEQEAAKRMEKYKAFTRGKAVQMGENLSLEEAATQVLGWCVAQA